jgi:hypothetical protein
MDGDGGGGGENQQCHHHGKEVETRLWKSICHSLSSGFVNAHSDSSAAAAVATKKMRNRSVSLGVPLRKKSVQAAAAAAGHHGDEQTPLQLMRASVVELDPLSKVKKSCNLSSLVRKDILRLWLKMKVLCRV